MNPTQFSAALGVPRTTLLGWEGGKTVPIETAEKLHKAFPKLNTEWLLSGEGEMFHGASVEKSDQMLNSSTFDEDPKYDTVSYLPERVTEEQIGHSVRFGEDPKNETVSYLPSDTPQPPALRGAELAPLPSTAIGLSGGLSLGKAWGYPHDVMVYKYRKGRAEPVPVNAPDPEGVVFIPIYNQTASAGPGQEPTQLVETEGMLPVLYDLFGIHRPENCGICRVVGDSMTDITLSNGDWCLFDRVDRKGDGIFVISMYGETRVKRLQYRLADRKIVIASENARRYPEPEVVGADTVECGDLVIHGRVFSWLHKHPY